MKPLLLFIILALAVWAQPPSASPRACTPESGNNCFLKAGPTGMVSVGQTVLSPTSGVIVPLAVATSTPISPAATGFYLNNNAGAVTYNLPAITTATVGMQMCFRNAVGKSGAITLQLPASTSVDIDGANGTAASTLVSSGALGDAVCVVAQAVGQYVGYVSSGAWTKN